MGLETVIIKKYNMEYNKKKCKLRMELVFFIKESKYNMGNSKKNFKQTVVVTLFYWKI